MLLCGGTALLLGRIDRSAVESRLLRQSRQGNWKAAVALLDELVEDGAVTTTAHNNAAAACSRAGQHGRALSLLKKLRDRGGVWDSYSFTTAVTVHGRRGEWQTALKVLRQMERSSDSPPPNEFVYGAAIGACAASAQWSDAIRLLKKMEADGIQPTTRCYNGALAACDKARQPEAALALLETMRTSKRDTAPPSVVSYGTALAALGRKPSAGASEKATQLLNAMKADGIEPTEVAYGAAASAHGASGSWENALQILQEMDEAGLKPTAVLLCNVLNACANGGAYEPALLVLRGMSLRYGIEPDVACYNAVIKACARGQQWQPAMSLLDQLGGSATERSHLGALGACASCGRWKEALDLLKSMHAEPETKPTPSVRCYTAAIAACGTAGEWKEALRLWAVLLTTVPRRADGPCLETALWACQNAGQWRAALRVCTDLYNRRIEPVEAPNEKDDSGADVFWRPQQPKTSPQRDQVATLNRVCVLHDQLTRTGALDNAISFEAAIHCCETWGVGEQLADILEELGGEYVRVMSWSDFPIQQLEIPSRMINPTFVEPVEGGEGEREGGETAGSGDGDDVEEVVGDAIDSEDWGLDGYRSL